MQNSWKNTGVFPYCNDGIFKYLYFWINKGFDSICDFPSYCDDSACETAKRKTESMVNGRSTINRIILFSKIFFTNYVNVCCDLEDTSHRDWALAKKYVQLRHVYCMYIWRFAWWNISCVAGRQEELL